VLVKLFSPVRFAVDLGTVLVIPLTSVEAGRIVLTPVASVATGSRS
jgi:hypothetical protein